MKLEKLAGATSEIWQIFIQDSSSTTGAGLTALAFNTASLTAYYHRDTDTTATAITLVTMTVGTFTSSGFKEIDATNMPGWYQFCPPNAALASGAKSCGFHLKGATNMAPLPIEVQLVSYNPDDTVRLGLTALPNVASGSAGAIPTTGTGANQIAVDGAGNAKADVNKWLAGTIPAVNVTGVPLVDLKYTLGTISPAAAGSVGIDWAQIVNKSTAANLSATTVNLTNTVTTYTGNTPQTGDNFARIGAAGAGLTAVGLTGTQTFNNTGTWTGNLTGSVGSVTTVSDKTGYSLSVTPPTAVQNADALLGRNIAGGSSTGRIVTDALRLLRNKWSVSGTTLTVTQEDDATTAWTMTITTDAAALPITSG